MHVPQTYTGPLLTPTRGNLLSLLPYLQRRQTLLTREKGFLQSSFGLFDVAQGFKGCSWLGVHFQPTPGSLGLPAPPPFLIILCTGNQRTQKKGNWQNGRLCIKKKCVLQSCTKNHWSVSATMQPPQRLTLFPLQISKIICTDTF